MCVYFWGPFSYAWLTVSLFNLWIIFFNDFEYHQIDSEAFAYIKRQLNITPFELLHSN